MIANIVYLSNAIHVREKRAKDLVVGLFIKDIVTEVYAECVCVRYQHLDIVTFILFVQQYDIIVKVQV